MPSSATANWDITLEILGSWECTSSKIMETKCSIIMQTVPQANSHLAQCVGTGRICDLPHWRNVISQDQFGLCVNEAFAECPIFLPGAGCCVCTAWRPKHGDLKRFMSCNFLKQVKPSYQPQSPELKRHTLQHRGVE